MSASFTITATEGTKSAANSTTQLTVNVNCAWTYGTYNRSTIIYVTIDGTRYSQSVDLNPNQSTSGSQTVFSKTVTIQHATSGAAKDVPISASMYVHSSLTVTGSKTVTVSAVPRGLVYIDNGSSWEPYQVYIDNGSSWDLYLPYIDNGSSWDLYS